ncbi:MAG: hypothetical protein IJ525_00175 [Alphaproteobacteria bacterium]|nr:hypothetical protein [Alphaproteobacteria bacterium]
MINYAMVTELKQQIAEQFGEILHFHDTCGGGMYFSIEKPNEKILSFLNKYFSDRGMQIKVSADGMHIEAE